MQIQSRLEILLWNIAILIMKILGSLRIYLDRISARILHQKGLANRVLLLGFAGFFFGFLFSLLRIWYQP